jgi:multidrug efflux pump subunit AcrB
MVEGIGDVDLDALQARADELAAKGNQQPGLVGLFNGFRARTPQLYVDIDREKAKSMGVALTDVFDTLQACVGSYYVNDFNRFGRTWQVNVQADAPFRADAETIRQFKVPTYRGEMVRWERGRGGDSAGPVRSPATAYTHGVDQRLRCRGLAWATPWQHGAAGQDLRAR